MSHKYLCNFGFKLIKYYGKKKTSKLLIMGVTKLQMKYTNKNENYKGKGCKKLKNVRVDWCAVKNATTQPVIVS